MTRAMNPLQPYQPAWWLPGPHAATIWGRVGRFEPMPDTRMERWDTPDGDFLELARMDSPDGSAAPRLLLLHGLEGGVRSHYVRALFREARARRWAADLLLFRSCGSEPNRLPRTYHSGETTDPLWVLERIVADFPNAPVGLVGVSLGGNVLCKLLGEQGHELPAQIKAAVAISVPFDLAKASRRIGQGMSTLYERLFLRSLVPKAMAKIARHPELSHLKGVGAARSLWDFDDQFTAPLHGFLDAADYYRRASALSFLPAVRHPTLLLSAVDDPFLPPAVLDQVRLAVAGNSAMHVEFPLRGGHVGFTSGRNPLAPTYYAEYRAAHFLAHYLAPDVAPHP